MFIFLFYFSSLAMLQLESSRFKGSVVVRIRSVKENRYLCVNSDGNLTVEVCFFLFSFYSFHLDSRGYFTFSLALWLFSASAFRAIGVIYNTVWGSFFLSPGQSLIL